MAKITKTKQTARKKTTKKINTDKWDDYSYWSEYGWPTQRAIQHKIADTFGMGVLGKRISQRGLNCYFNPADFTMSDKTPFGTVSVALFDGLVKCAGKDGGCVFKLGLSKEHGDELVDSEVFYKYAGSDTIYIDVLDTIIYEMSMSLRAAYEELKKKYGK